MYIFNDIETEATPDGKFIRVTVSYRIDPERIKAFKEFIANLSPEEREDYRRRLLGEVSRGVNTNIDATLREIGKAIGEKYEMNQSENKPFKMPTGEGFTTSEDYTKKINEIMNPGELTEAEEDKPKDSAPGDIPVLGTPESLQDFVAKNKAPDSYCMIASNGRHFSSKTHTEILLLSLSREPERALIIPKNEDNYPDLVLYEEGYYVYEKEAGFPLPAYRPAFVRDVPSGMRLVNLGVSKEYKENYKK